MNEQLTFTLLPRHQQDSAFDWMNIDCRGARVGKIATFVGLGLLVAGLIVSLLMKESPALWL